MKSVFCFLIGYFLGSFSPAAHVSRKRDVDLRENGTGNLGASNTLLVIGKKDGIIVMVLDILKAFLAARLAKLLFPRLAVAPLLAGGGAMVGHAFPFHLRFKGGKSLAAFAGMVLAYDPAMFLSMLILCSGITLAVNYSYAMPLSGGILFPVLVALRSRNLQLTLVALAAGMFLINRNWNNIARARSGEEPPIRDIIAKKLLH